MKLLPWAAEAAAAHSGIELAGIVDAAYRSSRLMLPRTAAGAAARRAFNPRGLVRISDRPPLLTTCGGVARRHRVPLLRSGAPGVNDPIFIDALAALRPDSALVLMVGQVFEPPLLSTCGAAANYHDGLLPAYRGVGATSWSVYRQEPQSGFSFNLLNEGIDAGPVLLQGSVDVRPGETTGQVERAKTQAARTHLKDVLALLLEGASGRQQRGDSSLFTRADLAAARAVGDSSKIEWNELRRRLRAFEEVQLGIDGEKLPVTAVRRGPRGPGKGLVFATADGVLAAPTRIKHMPPLLYRVEERRAAGSDRERQAL